MSQSTLLGTTDDGAAATAASGQAAAAEGAAQAAGQAQQGQSAQGQGGAAAGEGAAAGAAGDGAQQAQVAEWRKAIVEARAKDDPAAVEKLTKKLERFNDPGAMFDAIEESQRKISELTAKGTLRIPGADATPEDITAFHKALGVPEKDDGYKIDYKAAAGADYTPDDADKADLAALTKLLHAEGGLAASPASVQAVAKAYFAMKEQVVAQAEVTAQTEEARTEKTLKQEWGSDFTANMGFAKQGAKALFGANWNDLKNVRLPNGEYLGSSKPMIEAMARAGRIMGQDPLLSAMAGLEDKPQGLESRKSEIMSWARGTPDQRKKYELAQRPGGELEAINAKLAVLSKREAA